MLEKKSNLPFKKCPVTLLFTRSKEEKKKLLIAPGVTAGGHGRVDASFGPCCRHFSFMCLGGKQAHRGIRRFAVFFASVLLLLRWKRRRWALVVGPSCRRNGTEQGWTCWFTHLKRRCWGWVILSCLSASRHCLSLTTERVTRCLSDKYRSSIFVGRYLSDVLFSSVLKTNKWPGSWGIYPFSDTIQRHLLQKAPLLATVWIKSVAFF